MPSPSVSDWLGFAVSGQLSAPSAAPSLSSSGSTQFARLSPSLLSKPSSAPSFRSLSNPSQTSGVLAEFNGLDPAADSAVSLKLSLSSSVSALLPVPSRSVSSDSFGSNGKASTTSGTLSLSSSASHASP